MKKYHFITGLPRSGSTLIASVLKQNPRFYASITDSLAQCTKNLLETCQDGPGMKVIVPTNRRKNIIKGLFHGFYADMNHEVIFNTNRAWTVLTSQVNEIFPESKFIVCVRDINWILDSFETAHRNNSLSVNTVTGGMGKNVYNRVDALMNENGTVGFAYMGLKQAITGNEKHKLLLIEYDQLCQSPDSTIRKLYDFIEEPYFQHDYNNIEYSWDEYDAEIGLPLHRVRKEIKLVPRNFILPPDILNQFINYEVWRLI